MSASATIDELADLFFAECNDLNLANRLADVLVKNWGGTSFYLPKQKGKCSRRNAEIKALFTGKNHRELANAYDLTERTIRVILCAKK